MKKSMLFIVCVLSAFGAAFAQKPGATGAQDMSETGAIVEATLAETVPVDAEITAADPYVYCEIGSESVKLLGRSFYAYQLYGNSDRKAYILNDDGTKMVFRKNIGIINELSFRGWELAEVYVTVEGDGDDTASYTHFILKKRLSALSQEELTALRQ